MTRPIELQTLDQTRPWVGVWLMWQQAQLNTKDNTITVSKGTFNFESLIDVIWLDSEVEQKPFGRDKIRAAATLWFDNRRNDAVKRAREGLLAAPLGSRTELLNFVHALVGDECDPHKYELDCLVFEHFMWQVKRKIAGLEVEYHMMPIVVGKTGAGKSRALKRLLEPVNDLTNCPSSTECLGDERQHGLFNRYFVVFFDEMAKAGKQDVNQIKNLIQNDMVTHRIMRSNEHAVLKNNAVFLGCANNQVKQLIQDPTSARRYWEVTSADRLDWTDVNALDMGAVWACVDYKADSPIKAHIEAIYAIQTRDVRSHDMVETFVSLMMEDAPGDSVVAKQAYDRFVRFCDKQRSKPVLMTDFGQRMKQLVKCKRTKTGIHYTDKKWKFSSDTE